MRVFDTHQHLGALDLSLSHIPDWRQEDLDELGARRIAHLDKHGMDAAALMPALQYERPYGITDTQAVNDRMAEFRRRFPDRFPVALGTVEPLYGTEIAVQESRRCIEELELDGLAWHSRFQGTNLADPRMHDLIGVCAELGVPAFVHVMSESTLEAPWALEEIALRHPETTIVACDAFSGITQTRYIFGVAERCPNILFDTAMTVPLGRPLELFVKTFGAERLLFGTDVYTEPDHYAHCAALDELRASELSEAALEQVLWGNAARLFDRVSTAVS